MKSTTSRSLFSRSLISRPGAASLMVGVALAAGCAAQDDDDSGAAELALDTGDNGQAEGALLTAAVDGVTLGALQATPTDVAAAIQARLSTRFQPAGCATATATGTAVNVTFAGCTGPRGLRTVEGTLTLSVVSASATEVTLNATAPSIQIGAAELVLDATATYSTKASGASLTVQSRSGGVGPFGHSLEHTGQYVATWDGDCARVAGQWTTALDGRQRATEIDLRRCTASCATGTVTRVTRDGRTITITLDGAMASWTSSTGRSGTLPVRCAR